MEQIRKERVVLPSDVKPSKYIISIRPGLTTFTFEYAKIAPAGQFREIARSPPDILLFLGVRKRF